MVITLKVKGYYRDGGDGGGTSWLFNSLEAMKAYFEWDDDRLQEILDEDDPYGNGEISDVSISIEEKDGVYSLVDGTNVHWGQ